MRLLALYRGSDGCYEVDLEYNGRDVSVLRVVRAGRLPEEAKSLEDMAWEIAWRSPLYWEYVVNMLHYHIAPSKGWSINEEFYTWIPHYIAIIGARAVKDAVLNLYEYNDLMDKGKRDEARSRWRNAILFLGIAEQVYWRLTLELIPGLSGFIRKFREYLQNMMGTEKVSENILKPLVVFAEEFPSTDGGDAPITRVGWSNKWLDLVEQAYNDLRLKHVYSHIEYEEYEELAKSIAKKKPYIEIENRIAFYEMLSPLILG